MTIYSSIIPQKRRSNEIDFIKDIQTKCIVKNYTYLGYVGSWIGNKTTIVIFCNKHQYEFKLDARSFLSKKDRCCRLCGYESIAKHVKYRCMTPESVAITKINNRCSDQFTFLGYLIWDGIYTKLNIKCNYCNIEWYTTYDIFVNAKCGCPSCSPSGYNLAKDGFVYCLTLEDETGEKFIKYGITNNPKQRFRQHKTNIKTTNNKIIEIYCVKANSGTHAKNIENTIKQNCERLFINIEGFRKESTSFSNYDYIKSLFKECEIHHIQ